MNEKEPKDIIDELSPEERVSRFNKIMGIEPERKNKSVESVDIGALVVGVELLIINSVLKNNIDIALTGLQKLISKYPELNIRDMIKDKVESLIDWPRLNVEQKNGPIKVLEDVDSDNRFKILGELRNACIAEGIYGKESEVALKARQLIEELRADFLIAKYYDNAENINNILAKFRAKLDKSPSLKKSIKEEIEKLLKDIDGKMQDETLADEEKINFQNRKYFLIEQLENL